VSDEITISGGGSVAVSSDELLGFAARADTAASELARVRRRLDRLGPDRLGLDGGTTFAQVDADRSIADADARLASIGGAAEAVAHGLRMVAAGYGTADAIANSLLLNSAAGVGWMIGATGGALAVSLIPVLSAAVLGLGLGALAAPRQAADVLEAVIGRVGHDNAWLSDTATVALLRLVMSSLDDVVAGASSLGAVPARAIGDEGLGIVGLDTAAVLATILAGRAGALVETPVRVRRENRRPSAAVVAPPRGIADRIDRIPRGDAQVRVDRFDEPGRVPRFEVYIGGTIDFSPVATTEPWDMTSNVRAVAGIDAGSVRAAREAMADAGITSDSPVVFTGYSQGGLIAARLASSPEFATRGLITIGAPAGQVPLPDTFPAIVIEHTDDIVPATGGAQRNRGAVIVEREVFSGRDAPSGSAVPAHALAEYRSTAALADTAIDPRLVTARRELAAATATAAAAASLNYRAERRPEGR